MGAEDSGHEPLRTMLRAKIHRATVTHADVEYEGSITIDSALLEAADILPNEAVHVLSLANGERIETYAIAGERGSGVIGMNGPAALRIKPGERVIVLAYVQVPESRVAMVRPRIVLVDDHNLPIGEAAAQLGRR